MTPKKKKKLVMRSRARAWKGARSEIAIHSVARSDGLWIHTHGLLEHELPELEIRGAPTWAMEPGAKLLNHLADYLANPEKPVLPGHLVEVPGYGILQLVRAEPQDPIDDHYDHERWAVVSAPEACECEFCRARGFLQ